MCTASIGGILAAVALAVASGCANLPDLDFNPLLRVEHTADGAVEIEALGPLVDIRYGPEGVSHAVRPFYQHVASGPVSVTDVLPPLGRRYRNEGGTKFRFWPLIWTGERVDGPDGPEWDAVFFPLIFAGSGPHEGDAYFALFPVAGRIRDLFGLEQFDFFLWPLFMRTHMDISEESVSTTVLLLGGWTTGGPRDGSWRILPFYRHKLWRSPEGELRTDQHSVLWPIFTFGYDHMDEGSPSKSFAVWPLISVERSETWFRSSFLWPFFRVNRQTDPLPSEGGDFYYDLPWPFFRWSRDEDQERFWAWPFYWHHTRKTSETRGFLWPLVWARSWEGRTAESDGPTRSFRREDRDVIPFWHGSRRTVEGQDQDDTQHQVWPLWHDSRTAAGRVDRAFPSLLPMRHLELVRPADELYSFAWTLWRQRSDGVSNETRLLFDTVMLRSSPEGARVSIPFLYAGWPESGGSYRHQVLWGLVATRTGEEGLRSVSLLGFDLWTR